MDSSARTTASACKTSKESDATVAADSADSLRRCALAVTCWCLVIGLLPPHGLLWQLGTFDAVGHWLVSGVLATLNLSGFVH